MDSVNTHSHPAAQWFCLRSQPRREKVAAAELAQLPGIEVLFPRARYERKGPKGKRMVIEPMFPNYLFARFDAHLQHRTVAYAKGVGYIVKCGRDPAVVPDEIINELHAMTDDGLLDMPSAQLQLGDTIKIVAGIFQGQEAEIIGLAPAKERIKILLEILGRATVVDIGMDEVDRPVGHPLSG